MTNLKTTEMATNSGSDAAIPQLVKSTGKFFAAVIGSAFKTLASFLVFFLIISAIGGTLSGSAGDLPLREVQLSGEGIGKVVVVPIRGIILNQGEKFVGTGEMITPEMVAKILRALEKDDKVKAVILDIDSPGGSAVASDRIYESIENFKKKSSIPVIALMGDTVASGGYYIASATDKIIANPSTLTGSIGVIASSYKISDFMEKLGIKQEVYKKGLYKDILSNTRETTDEEKAIIDRILEDAYNQFLTRVAMGRKMDMNQVQNVANGKIYSGKEAKEVGLVDALGNLDKAVEVSKELTHLKTIRVVRIESGGLFSQVFNGFSLQAFLPFLRPLTVAKVWYLML